MVLVVTRAELKALRTVEDLVTLIWEKYAELKVNGVVLIADSHPRRRTAKQIRRKR